MNVSYFKRFDYYIMTQIFVVCNSEGLIDPLNISFLEWNDVVLGDENTMYIEALIEKNDFIKFIGKPFKFPDYHM